MLLRKCINHLLGCYRYSILCRWRRNIYFSSSCSEDAPRRTVSKRSAISDAMPLDFALLPRLLKEKVLEELIPVR